MNRAANLAIILSAALPVLTACRAPLGVFRPTTPNVGAAPGGQATAVYEVPLGRSKGGQVQLWSDGVVLDGRSRFFHLAVLLRNDASTAMTLKPADVHLGLDDDLPDLRPRETQTLEVGPGETVDAVFRFPLPGRFSETAPEDFDVDWSVSFGPETYRQTTHFTRRRPRGVVPGPLETSDPIDQPHIDGPDRPPPVGIPFGVDPAR